MSTIVSVNRIAARNWLFDIAVFAGGLLAILSGVYFLFLPIGGYQGGRNPLYGITLFFERHVWEDLHVWTGIAFVIVVILHVALHWSWVSGMSSKILQALFKKTAGLSRKSQSNAVIDLAIGAGFLVSALSGIAFLIEPILVAGLGTAWALNGYVWDVIHTWSSIVMVIGILLHLGMHWGWIKVITRRMFNKNKKSISIILNEKGAA